MPRLFSIVCLFSMLVLGYAGCDDDSSGPAPSLVGGWDIIGYSDHGVSGATTGSAVFRDDGTFLMLGTVTYPGEPTDSLNVSGTYQVMANAVTLTTQESAGAWSLVFVGDAVTLSLLGADPPTVITLRRPS